ncbi:hypothetical protein F3286_00060 [Listeria monocytogenes]|nr:hypothetical protein [Listeria monocytogenes]
MEQLETIIIFTNKVLKDWDNSSGWAPESVSLKLNDAMLDWMIELTDCLSIWTTKEDLLTEGELILAYTNLGSLVESWLKLFYCIYYEDYKINPKRQRGTLVEPNDMMFQSLKEFSTGKLWEKNDNWFNWIEKIQQRRNAIHSFNYRDIGTQDEFFEDIEKFNEFIHLINDRFPPAPSEAHEYI